MSAGIPQITRELTVHFHYNDLASLEKLFATHSGRIACLIMEPEKGEDPRDGFLHRVQQLCQQNGVVFILDEMITGFRWHLGGGQTYHNVIPDLSTFGKAMGNGFSVSALVGRKEIMRLGGLDHDRDRVFLLSLTHGAENPCLAAALEVMRIYQEEPVIETLWQKGRRLQEAIDFVIGAHGLQEYFAVVGKPCCLVYSTLDANRKPSQAFRTLFLQETIRRGLLAPSFIVSYSHSDADIDRTVDVVDAALEVYALALEQGVEKHLVGRPVQPVWRRYN
jgi:glutamate-1-semialdehyde 2,1-aminomutase